MGTSGIGLVLSDVDGTLLTSDEALTRTTVDAVRALHAAGIRFTVTSSRPRPGSLMLARSGTSIAMGNASDDLDALDVSEH